LSNVPVKVSRRALSDLETIVTRIALDSPDTARQLKQELESRFLDAARVGTRLRKRTEFGDDIRVLQHKPWMIFYCVKDNTVEILRVLHGAMHPKRLKAGTRDKT
jgi:plasmid stabilization system protein ParE